MVHIPGAFHFELFSYVHTRGERVIPRCSNFQHRLLHGLGRFHPKCEHICFVSTNLNYKPVLIETAS